ncbi:MAG TPA: cache domain-containing protein [Candidatus Acidoferrum sp.]|nr:cache domain-containing protein [Candidatus Acidoferrum sp.]
MLPLQFFGQNIHFAISLFTALVFFAAFWLYFDAWTAKRELKELVKWAGFLLVALAYVVHATVIEQSVLGQSLLGDISENIAMILRIIGFVGIIVGQLIDPLQEKPKLTGLSADQFNTGELSQKNLPAFGFASLGFASYWLPPIGALAISALYWRRATTGLERHLKPVAVAFGLLFISEGLSLASLWRTTDNPIISSLVAAFGPFWITEHVFLLAGALVLGSWVWRYLTRRFLSQLFMIFTAVTLAIFLLTTVSFTFLLVNNVQDASLNNLGTAASVLNYALGSKESETLANTEAVAESPDIISAVMSKNHKALVNLTDTFLHDKKQSSLVITSDTGQVLLRAENPDRFGDSLSSDTLIRRALIGQSNSSVSTQDGVLAPLIYIKSATPIRDTTTHQIVGSAVVGLVIDNAFVDGIKHATGLDSAVYAGATRSATTFVAPDGLSRLIGVTESSDAVHDQVLKRGQTFKGSLSIQNRQYLAVYAPLKDIDNTVVGMLFIGQPQATILQAAGKSIELTFLVTALLLVIAIIPAYLISRYLARQLD